MAGFKPGASPPPVRTPTRFVSGIHENPRLTCEAGPSIKPGGVSPRLVIKQNGQPEERAAALSPPSWAPDGYAFFTWGLRPRLYAFTRFAGCRHPLRGSKTSPRYVLYQYHITRDHASGCYESAVLHPVERKNFAVFEIGQLLWRTAVDRLSPEIIDTAAMIHICEV